MCSAEQREGSLGHLSALFGLSLTYDPTLAWLPWTASRTNGNKIYKMATPILFLGPPVPSLFPCAGPRDANILEGALLGRWRSVTIGICMILGGQKEGNPPQNNLYIIILCHAIAQDLIIQRTDGWGWMTAKRPIPWVSRALIKSSAGRRTSLRETQE